MYDKRKSSSPKNAVQIYIDGKRYRSIFEAACDTELNFPNLIIQLNKAEGGCIVIKKHNIVSEKWIFNHPDFLLKA